EERIVAIKFDNSCPHDHLLSLGGRPGGNVHLHGNQVAHLRRTAAHDKSKFVRRRIPHNGADVMTKHVRYLLAVWPIEEVSWSVCEKTANLRHQPCISFRNGAIEHPCSHARQNVLKASPGVSRVYIDNTDFYRAPIG